MGQSPGAGFGSHLPINDYFRAANQPTDLSDSWITASSLSNVAQDMYTDSQVENLTISYVMRDTNNNLHIGRSLDAAASYLAWHWSGALNCSQGRQQLTIGTGASAFFTGIDKISLYMDLGRQARTTMAQCYSRKSSSPKWDSLCKKLILNFI